MIIRLSCSLLLMMDIIVTVACYSSLFFGCNRLFLSAPPPRPSPCPSSSCIALLISSCWIYSEGAHRLLCGLPYSMPLLCQTSVYFTLSSHKRTHARTHTHTIHLNLIYIDEMEEYDESSFHGVFYRIMGIAKLLLRECSSTFHFCMDVVQRSRRSFSQFFPPRSLLS